MSFVMTVSTERASISIVETSLPSLRRLYLYDMVDLGSYTPTPSAAITVVVQSLSRQGTPLDRVIKPDVLRIPRRIVSLITLKPRLSESLLSLSLYDRSAYATVTRAVRYEITTATARLK